MSTEEPWACPCGPHEEQIWDDGYFDDPDIEPVDRPLLCFKHRKHEPCRPCLRAEGFYENPLTDTNP